MVHYNNWDSLKDTDKMDDVNNIDDMGNIDDMDDMNGIDNIDDVNSYMNTPSDDILTSSLVNRIENSSLETQRMIWHFLNVLERPANFDEPLDELEQRVSDWWERDDLSGVIKSSSSRGSLALLSDASVRTIWDYCKYLGISPSTDKQENVKAIWNCLKEHPQYLAYIFTWEEIKDLQEFFRLRNGVSNHQPEDETVAKAISLGFLDAKEEEYNRSMRFVLRQTKDAPRLLGTLSDEEWQTVCENGQKAQKQCLQLLEMYGVMDLSAFCDKYREYYDTGAEDNEILRCVYLSGSFCRKLLTATSEGGISYASLPEINLSQVLEIWEQEDIGAMEYRPMSPTERNAFEKGICERYPEWDLFNQYLDVNYEMSEEEVPGEWLHSLYYTIMDGESLYEFCKDFYKSECLEGVDEFVIFWNLAIGAYIRTGLPQYKGYSREEYAKMKNIPLSQLFGEEDFVDSITETTHIYQMPPEIQLEVHEIQSHENNYRYQKRRYETLLPKLPNGNCEIEFYYSAALFNAEDFIGARKYYKRILKFYPGDDTVTTMLNYTLQNLQKQREKKETENLTLWDRMTDMARRGELADIMPQGNPSTYRREQPKIGRNDPCPCGSGKKYKNCCGR